METAEVTLIEFHCSRLVFVSISSTISLVLFENLLYFNGEILPVIPHVAEPVWNGESGACKNEAYEAIRSGERIVNGKHASPGMSEEMDLSEVERLHALLKFLDKTAS